MPSSDIDRYAAAYAHCLTKAETIHIPEIAALWFAIAGSYKFLREREQRALRGQEDRQQQGRSHARSEEGRTEREERSRRR